MISILPGTIRDYCYISANLRVSDREEIICQLPEDADMRQLGILSYEGADPHWRFTAFHKNLPAAAYGFQWLNAATLLAWAWGTDDFIRCAPAMGRHILALKSDAKAAGVRRVEARALSSHAKSARWLGKMGARPATKLQQFGRGGECFTLYEWLL